MRQPPPTSRSSKPRRTPPASPSKSATSVVIAARTRFTGAPTAVASVTMLIGSSATIRMASSARSICASSTGAGTSVVSVSSVVPVSSVTSTSLTPTPSTTASAATFSTVIVGSQIRQVLFGPVLGGPPQGQFAERLQLLEGDRGTAVQLEHGQEPRDDDALLLGPGHQLAKVHRLALAQHPDDDRRLLPDADQRRVQVVEPDHGDLARRHGERGERGEVVEAQRPDELGRALAELVLQP